MSEEREDLVLHGGYAVAVEPDHKVLRLTAPDGRVCLKIVLLPEGPMVELSAVALAIATQGDVSVDCERFRVNARQEIVTEAVAQRHCARLGGIDLVANDDVSLKGERIRLNAPDPEPRVAPARAVLEGGKGRPPDGAT
jgi:hypothetical protein